MTDPYSHRRIFAVVRDTLHIHQHKPYAGHVEWFIQEGWISNSSDPAMENIVRGYVLNGVVVAYRGKAFSAFDVDVDLLPKLSELRDQLDLPATTPVYFGGKIGSNDEWVGKYAVGTIQDLIDAAAREEYMIEII